MSIRNIRLLREGICYSLIRHGKNFVRLKKGINNPTVYPLKSYVGLDHKPAPALKLLEMHVFQGTS